jgi:hypothetical protein
VKEFIDTFGIERIECILGDREFIGKNWVEWLDQERIPYVFTIREKGQYIGKRNGKMVLAASLFKGLQAGERKYIGKRKIGKVDSYLAHITALKTANHQMVVLLHSPTIQQPCQLYRRRWEIELLFKVMKTSGFDLEATHVIEADRLETLLAIVAISCCFAYRIGIYCMRELPPKIKKHGYKPFNTVRFGLDLLIDMVRGKFVDTHTTYYKKLVPLLAIICQYFNRIKIFVVEFNERY